MVEFSDPLVKESLAVQRAYLGSFPYNLVKSGNLEEYYELLTDFQFLAAKIKHLDFGVQALIDDYELVADSEVLTNPQYNLKKVKALQSIQGALRLSAHILVEDKTQLAEQLWGRMQCLDVPEIQVMLSQAKQSKTTWLRLLTPSLTPPGGRLLRTLTGHGDWIKAIAVTPDGKRVVSGSRDNTLKVWNLETAEELFTLTGHSDWVNAVAITPDGKRVISGSGDNTLKVWNLETTEELFTLTGHSDWVKAIAVTPDGKWLISGSRDNTLKVWNLETAEELLTLTGHRHLLSAVAVTPDGKRVISSSEDNSLEVWNLETTEKLFTLIGHRLLVIAIAVTPDGKRVISSSVDNTLKVWNLTNGEELLTLTGHRHLVIAIAVTPDGKRVISGSVDNTLKVWNLTNGEELFTLTGHSDWVNTVAVTPDGKRVISGSRDNTLKVWNLETAEELFTLTGHRDWVRSVAVTPDDKRVISGSVDHTLKVWNLETAEELLTLRGHGDWVNAVAVTPDGKRVISGSGDNTLKVWNLETVEEVFTLRGHGDWIKAIAVTPDGKWVISGSKDYTLKVWNLTNGEELFTLTGHRDSVYAVAVTPDGKRVISGSGDNTLKVWNLETAEEMFTLTGHSNWVRAITVTPDGKWLISGSEDNTLKVWNLTNGEELFTLTSHSDSVYAVAVTPDGKQVISGSRDNTIKIWDLSTGEVIAGFTGESRLYCCAVAPDGMTIVAGDQFGRVHFLRLEGMKASTPRSPSVTNTRGHPLEFEQLIIEKSENFVGREFVFAAINEFLHQCNSGYFTLIGAPGSGKSAILAQYVTENPQVVYYNAQVEGKNQADEFLTTVCTQLMGSRESGVGSRDVAVPDNATEGSWFLSLLLQKISDKLEPDQRLIIAIDALDTIDRNSQPPGSNLFYLPRYLPERVYFLLTRRPFLREKSGLLIETPSQMLDLGDYPEQNREDVQTYIRNYLTPLDPPQPPLKKGGLRSEEGLRTEESDSYSSSSISPPFLRGAGGDRERLAERSNLKSWLTTHNISEQEFSDRLTTQSENNFMYLSQILPAIAEGGRSAASIAQNFYSELFQFDRLPPSLETYYQSHWQRMAQSTDLTAPNPPSDSPLLAQDGQGERSKALAVLNILVQQEQPISTEAIAQIIDEDEYEVEEVLETWFEFLQQQRISGEIRYSLYHPSFRDWLGRQFSFLKPTNYPQGH